MMTAVLVDSNVLLDLMTEERRWLSWSAEAVEKAADRFRLVINSIIYAEVSIRYSRIAELEASAAKRGCWTAKQFVMRPLSSLESVFWFIGSEGERSNHPFPTFLLAPTRRLPAIGC
jgi:hypothetical protein